MDIELLVDAPRFWSRLRRDVAQARRKVWVQTFSFEGDRVGTALGRALERCAAADRRLLVDGFSLLYHNDRLIPGPAWLDRSFRREVLLTHRWVRRLREGGTGVRFGNRPGPSPVSLLRRNHKKLAVIDDRVVYLGGINFSEHNFEWHDMMLRVEDRRLGRLMARDFGASWAGRPRRIDGRVGPLRVLSLNGRANARALAPVLEAVRGARHSIDVASAYLSHPFTDHLAAARRRGVRVRVLTPGRNNKGNLARHVLHAAHRHGFEVFRYPGMSHLKAMLIDDRALVAGSSNFDFMSYHILEELVVLTEHPGVVEAFRERVWRPDVAAAGREPVRASLGTRLGHAAVLAGAAAAGLLAVP
ncbi:MAG: phosphatidylserine/phosphatidylglycerophosphate/cardiolipin synthase family protein [Gemmatimonadota bacterium]|jgi:cardiolipin synthase